MVSHTSLLPQDSSLSLQVFTVLLLGICPQQYPPPLLRAAQASCGQGDLPATRELAHLLASSTFALFFSPLGSGRQGGAACATHWEHLGSGDLRGCVSPCREMVWADTGGCRVSRVGSGGGSCALCTALSSLLQMFSSCVEVQPKGSGSRAVGLGNTLL